jgi:hypothetical protein
MVAWKLFFSAIVIAPAWIFLDTYASHVTAADLDRISKEASGFTDLEAQIFVALLLYAIGWFSAWCLRGAIRITRRVRDNPRRHEMPRFNTTFMVIAFALVATTALLYSVLFMLYVYPTIPEQFGGGRPQRVSVLFASDASQDPGEIGLPLEPQKQRLSVPLELVHETDSLYVIRLPNNQIMRIDKDLVSVVIPWTN